MCDTIYAFINIHVYVCMNTVVNIYVDRCLHIFKYKTITVKFSSRLKKKISNNFFLVSNFSYNFLN